MERAQRKRETWTNVNKLEMVRERERGRKCKILLIMSAEKECEKNRDVERRVLTPI